MNNLKQECITLPSLILFSHHHIMTDREYNRIVKIVSSPVYREIGTNISFEIKEEIIKNIKNQSK